ncbi:MAG: FAD-binding oxidoreductase [Ktedonobacterales bacterium]
MTTSRNASPTTTHISGSLETLSGWGMRATARCRVARPVSSDELATVLAEARAAGMPVGLRGAGYSYGDAALIQAGVALDCSWLNHVLVWDAATGVITVEPGVTIAQLWRHTLPDGWRPTIVPGTSAVTVGGAASTNIHGKNNWRIGCFGDHILSFELLLPSGEMLTCSRHEHADLFHVAIGGMGLFGAFTSLTLQTYRVASGLVAARQTAHPSLDALLAAHDAAATDGWADDLVTWVDTGAQGSSLGRGLLKATRDLAPGEDAQPDLTRSVAWQERASLPIRLAHRAPRLVPWLARPLSLPLGVAFANRAQWLNGSRSGAEHEARIPFTAANFPLDAIPNWRDAYRPGGLMQHQSFVPQEEARRVFRLLLERSHQAGIVPSFAVLKKQRTSDFLLNYLVDGYSLALDYPVRRSNAAQVAALLGELNDIVADAGGRVYFAKDNTLTSAQAERMYGPATLARFHALKAQVDPDGLLQTELYRRVLAPGL